MPEKYKYQEFESLLSGTEPEIIRKAFSLANGMILVYGYDKELALKEAVSIAKGWYDYGKPI